MFKKLNKSFTHSDFKVTDEVVKFGYVESDKFYGLRYDNVDVESSPFFNVIPEKYRSGFYLHLMRLNLSAPPHTDSKILTTINFYIKTGNAVTTFYDIISDVPSTSQMENQTNGKMFSLDDLVVADKFVASDFDIYILDVTKPHSVQFTESNDSTYERTAFVLQSPCFTFDAVCKMLHATNYL